MSRHKSVLMVCILCFWAVASCSAGDRENPTLQLTPLAVAAAPTNVNFQLPDFGTPDQNEKVYDDPRQISDGRLKLTIVEENKQCHKLGTFTNLSNGKVVYKPGDLVPIILTFENLTNEPLSIADYNVVAFASSLTLENSARVIPVLSALNGQRITSLDEEQSVGYQIYQTPSSTLVRELFGKSNFEITIKYLPPAQVLYLGESGERGSMPLPAGHYLLKYVYDATGYQGSWSGVISSNQIEICIID